PPPLHPTHTLPLHDALPISRPCTSTGHEEIPEPGSCAPLLSPQAMGRIRHIPNGRCQGSIRIHWVLPYHCQVWPFIRSSPWVTASSGNPNSQSGNSKWHSWALKGSRLTATRMKLDRSSVRLPKYRMLSFQTW